MKTLVIQYCDHCPFFDSEDDGWGGPPWCKKKDCELERGESAQRYFHPIPAWCPLEDTLNVVSPGLVPPGFLGTVEFSEDGHAKITPAKETP